ncbi:MAG: class I SAM-dependent methyltransferase [Syntrophobacteraceae bacterium]
MRIGGVQLAERFFQGTGHSYDHIVSLFTLGFDLWWKRKILQKIPGNPLRIIDQASGTGILTFKIAGRFPEARVVGVELRDEYLVIARQKAAFLNLRRVEFVLGRAEEVFLEGSFDCITSSYLAKYAETDRWVRNCKRMLRDGGLLIAHDFTYPPNPYFAALWEYYFRIMQTVGSWRYPEWRTVFFELPELLRRTKWVPELRESLAMHGFSDISLEFRTFGSSAIITARK